MFAVSIAKSPFEAAYDASPKTRATITFSERSLVVPPVFLGGSNWFRISFRVLSTFQRIALYLKLTVSRERR